MGSAAEAAIGYKRDRLAQPFANDCTRHAEHLAHARPAFWAFIADHNYISRTNVFPGDCGHCIFFGFENSRRPTVAQPFVPADFGHASLRRKIATQDHQTACSFERSVQGRNDLLAWSLLCALALRADCQSRDCARLGVNMLPAKQTPCK